MFRFVLVLGLGFAALTAATTTSGFSAGLGRYRGSRVYETFRPEMDWKFQGRSPAEVRELWEKFKGHPLGDDLTPPEPLVTRPEKPPERFQHLDGLNPGPELPRLRRSPSIEHETNPSQE